MRLARFPHPSGAKGWVGPAAVNAETTGPGRCSNYANSGSGLPARWAQQCNRVSHRASTSRRVFPRPRPRPQTLPAPGSGSGGARCDPLRSTLGPRRRHGDLLWPGDLIGIITDRLPALRTLVDAIWLSLLLHLASERRRIRRGRPLMSIRSSGDPLPPLDALP
jgi:hypothetical protein